MKSLKVCNLPLHQELQNHFDLKEQFPNSNDSHEEEEEQEEDGKGGISRVKRMIKRVRLFMRTKAVRRVSHQYHARPEAKDRASYMNIGTFKFGANCKFNHPIRRKNQSQLLLLLLELLFRILCTCTPSGL
ncbi:hypothetical protein NC651_038917 [Populus alba x Populus x berolinensis]|nr:hypothetical protein NC651_038917 [Populus alba x Populus x berolinensis]